MLSDFGGFFYFDASPYEHFNFITKMCIRMKSTRKGTTLEESVNINNSTNTKGSEAFSADKPIGWRTRLSTDGVKMSFENFSKGSCSSLKHLSRDGLNALRSYIVEAIAGSDK